MNILTHLCTSPVICSHFTLGNPKIIFNIIINILIVVFMLHVSVYLLLFSASCYLHSPRQARNQKLNKE